MGCPWGVCGCLQVSVGCLLVSVGCPWGIRRCLRGVCGHSRGVCGCLRGVGQHLRLRRRLLTSPVHSVTNSLPSPLLETYPTLPLSQLKKPFLLKGKAAGPPAAGRGGVTRFRGESPFPAATAGEDAPNLSLHWSRALITTRLCERHTACPWLNGVPKFMSFLELPNVANIRNWGNE